jgi:hypothetical protein
LARFVLNPHVGLLRIRQNERRHLTGMLAPLEPIRGPARLFHGFFLIKVARCFFLGAVVASATTGSFRLLRNL